MASSPLRSTLVVIVVSVSSLFARAGDADPQAPDFPRDERAIAAERPPLPTVPDVARELAAIGPRAPRLRFPSTLVAVPLDRVELSAGDGPGRCSVTPGRAACDRQSVPVRSRRKARVWERVAIV